MAQTQTPSELDLHLIVDGNYATHKHLKVKVWLARRLPFSATLNPDQRLLAEHGEAILPRSEPQRDHGVFRDMSELITAIQAYVERRNRHRKPF